MEPVQPVGAAAATIGQWQMSVAGHEAVAIGVTGTRHGSGVAMVWQQERLPHYAGPELHDKLGERDDARSGL